MSNPGPPPGPPEDSRETSEPAAVPPPPPPADAAPAESGARPPRRRRGVLVGVLAAVVLLLIPGGVFAWRALDGGGPQPHDVLPAEAIGYLRVDMDPSAEQKIDAFRFLQNFPTLSEATGITEDDQDLRELLFDRFAESTGCELSFADEVEPWLGHRVGGAVLPPGSEGEAPGFALALQTDDEQAARDAFDTALGCGDASGSVGMSYADGYLILAETQENADRYANDAQESSLSDNEEFSEAMNHLGDPGIASVWISGSGMYDAFGEAFSPGALGSAGPLPGDEALPGEGGLPQAPDVGAMVDDSYRSVAAAFRFDADYAEIATVTTGDAYKELDTGGVNADVPEDTSLLFGLAGGNELVTENWDLVTEAYPDASADIDEFTQQTGLALPEDLGTLLGDSLVVAVDGSDLDLQAIAQEDLSSLNAGVKVDTDVEAFGDVWSTVEDLATQAGQSLDGLPVQETDDGYIVATSDDYASRLSEDGSLGESDAYTSAVADAEEADAALYLDLNVIEDDILDGLADQGLGDNELESLRALRSLGLSARSHDGYAVTTLRVSAE
ncbi:uncharacterized protein DUF3352 [Haloactinopolyspora alba]|uniref:Uncharacterized protein DUF3352 n=1 Tax=Haloactinopolyspora alba TaxID=648780 RepID=A0A2P8DFX2_9ACTN|nr:DUF3352 domain-containing protein [Haloactinopolyspora alba]PSK96107.1 uncharacterized protein DUF3352 [Haloactinopolyspora alba]